MSKSFVGWQFREKEEELQKQGTPFYHPVLLHLLSELKSEKVLYKLSVSFRALQSLLYFVNELSLSEQKTRRKCLCSKHVTGGVSAGSHVFSLCQWNAQWKPVWHFHALSAIRTITGWPDRNQDEDMSFPSSGSSEQQSIWTIIRFQSVLLGFYDT